MKATRGPLLWVFALLAMSVIHQSVAGPMDPHDWKRLDYLYRLGFAVLAGWFVMVDPKNRKEGWPSDHVAIFSFALFPLYLLTTRKWQGLGILCALVAAFVLSSIVPLLLR